ncbi:MAG: sigma-70 family RNA polymerase sigma factor [Patescibacteria group bacterium]
MKNDVTDEQLIANYDTGNEEAFALLIQRYLKPVFNFAYRLSSDTHDAEDIAQESFLKAWRKLKQYKRDKNFKPWLFSIVHNTAMDLLRKKKDFVFSDFPAQSGSALGGENDENFFIESLTDPDPLPDEILAKTENKKLVEKLFTHLAPIYKEVLQLRYNNDLTFEEIGEVLGKPLHTVKSQHRRALIQLKEMLKKDL